MSDYLDTTSEEYIQKDDTTTLAIESDIEHPEVSVEDKMYGINKPHRITIRAKISHDKD